MSVIDFRYKQIEGPNTKPVNQKKKLVNELKMMVSLSPFLDHLNEVGAYVLVTISENGEIFNNEIVGGDIKTKYIPFISKNH